MAGLRRAAECIGVRVLEQQQRVAEHAGRALRRQLALPGPRGHIVDRSGADDLADAPLRLQLSHLWSGSVGPAVRSATLVLCVGMPFSPNVASVCTRATVY